VLIFLCSLSVTGACAAHSGEASDNAGANQSMKKAAVPVNEKTAPPAGGIPSPPINAAAQASQTPAANKAEGANAGGAGVGSSAGSKSGTADLGFEASLRAVSPDHLLIRYTVNNRSGKPYLLINRPPARPGASAPLPNPNFVYVETQADGTVLISKRVREPSSDTTVFIPDTPGATLLAPGGSFTEEVSVDLAARRQRASQTGKSAPEIPNPVRRVRFCLGVAPSEGITAKPFGQGKNAVLYPDPGAVLLKQQMLCSETVELK
jgi:hypothetical protein